MPKKRLIGVVMVMMTLLLTANSIAAIDTSSKSKVEALVRQATATHDVNLESALLARARSKDEIKSDDGKPVNPQAHTSSKAGCYGYPIKDRHTIELAGINLAWQEVIVGGFCWDGKKITWNGGVKSRRWSAAPYCWKDTSEGQYWAYYPKWIKAYAVGTLGGNAIWGCISLEHSEAWLDYANGGGVFRH